MCVTHMCVSRLRRRVFTCTNFSVPVRHVCVPGDRVFVIRGALVHVCLCFPHAHKCVCSRVQYTCVCSTCAHVCVHVYTFVSSTCTHMCVHVCAHFSVPIGHVFVFQVNTRLFSDEHSHVCVCVFRVHIFVCVHVCGNVCSTCFHTCVFELDKCLRSRRTHGLLSDEHTGVCSGCAYM